MIDRWADIRKRLLTGRWFDHELTDLEIEHVKSMEADIERLLADADALLAVKEAAHSVATYWRRRWEIAGSPDLVRIESEVKSELTKSLAALPDRLTEEV